MSVTGTNIGIGTAGTAKLTANGPMIRVTYADTFGIDTAAGGAACRWELKFTGVSCATPGKLVYDAHGNANGSEYSPGSVVGTCFGLAAGSYDVGVFVGATPSHAGQNKCDTGWDGGLWTIEAEEVF